MGKRVRHRLYILSDAYGFATKFIVMLVLLESILALVIVGTTATTGVLFGGPVAALVFLACFVVTMTPLYFWNKARKIRGDEAYDDRLTDDQMTKGRERVISEFEKQRQDEAAYERTE